MLKQNTTILAQYPFRLMGGGVAGDRPMFGRGDRCNWFIGENPRDRTAGFPNGHLAPSSWTLPQISGGMSSMNMVNGSGAFSASGALGLNAISTLLGSGDITAAALALVVSAVANLTGSGSLTPAIVGKLEAAAALAGAGNLAGAAGALASLVSSLSGSGLVTATPYAQGSMSTNIKGYGDLTPEGLRDLLWNATAANFNQAGTMGQKINSAASGGVDYNALGQAVWQIIISNPTPGSAGDKLLNALSTGNFLALKD